ncbi:MAG: hypothetical protein ACTTH7_09455, partial [Treponema sp.]
AAAQKTHSFTAIKITVTKASTGGNLTALSIKDISKITVAGVAVKGSQSPYTVEVTKELNKIVKGDVVIAAEALNGLKSGDDPAAFFDITVGQGGSEISIDLTAAAQKTHSFTAIKITVTKQG